VDAAKSVLGEHKGLFRRADSRYSEAHRQLILPTFQNRCEMDATWQDSGKNWIPNRVIPAVAGIHESAFLQLGSPVTR
jgi:hypothetical protein